MEQKADGGSISGGGNNSGEPENLTLEVVDSLSAVPASDWDALLGPDPSPFLEHRFLSSLEEAGTLGEENGWIPRIPLIKSGSCLLAAAPVYIKLHSHGEFVFDWAWADASERIGVPYYPKLLVGVPFTPVTGRRLLTAQGADRGVLIRMLGRLLIELAQQMGLSSVHVNFAEDDEIEGLVSAGFLRRDGIQYHWFRNQEQTFDDYLTRFRSKRKNQVKRERRALQAQGLQIEVHTGDQLTSALMDTAFGLYKSTVDKFYWGRQYLNRALFELWRERTSDRLEVVTAMEEGGQVVAGAINFVGGPRLYGRYWGCFKDIKHLHFNVCYYAGIERCFEAGLQVFEPGAGGQQKLTRGFEPTLTSSAHWLRHEELHQALSHHLAAERIEVRGHQQRLSGAMGTRENGK